MSRISARAFMATLSTAGRIDPEPPRVPSVYEVAGRERKALAIVHICEQCGITADDALGASVKDRQDAARAAGVKADKPPSDQTWEIVVAMLRSREGEMA